MQRYFCRRQFWIWIFFGHKLLFFFPRKVFHPLGFLSRVCNQRLNSCEVLHFSFIWGKKRRSPSFWEGLHTFSFSESRNDPTTRGFDLYRKNKCAWWTDVLVVSSTFWLVWIFERWGEFQPVIYEAELDCSSRSFPNDSFMKRQLGCLNMLIYERLIYETAHLWSVNWIARPGFLKRNWVAAHPRSCFSLFIEFWLVGRASKRERTRRVWCYSDFHEGEASW